MDTPLIFLLKLAWTCRYRLPLLITVAFMALDIRMQLEIHVQTRRIHRNPQLTHHHRRPQPTQAPDDVSNASSNSWLTMDDDSDEEEEDDIIFENAMEDILTPSPSSQNVDN